MIQDELAFHINVMNHLHKSDGSLILGFLDVWPLAAFCCICVRDRRFGDYLVDWDRELVAVVGVAAWRNTVSGTRTNCEFGLLLLVGVVLVCCWFSLVCWGRWGGLVLVLGLVGWFCWLGFVLSSSIGIYRRLWIYRSRIIRRHISSILYIFRFFLFIFKLGLQFLHFKLQVSHLNVQRWNLLILIANFQ